MLKIKIMKKYLENILKGKIVLVFFLILSIFINTKIMSETIKQYDVIITINNDATLDIKEIIDYEFDEPRHGIYRDILLRSKEKGVDVYKSFVKMNKITRNNIEEDYEEQNFPEGKRYRVGSADKYVNIGVNRYEFDYKIYNAVFENEGIYQIYFNAIGQFWNIPIEKSNIIIKYANSNIENSEINKIEIYTGEYGQSNKDNYVIVHNNKEIKINTKETLSPYNGLTFMLNLKTNKINQTIIDKLKVLFYANPIIIFGPIIVLVLALYSFITWILFGRNPSRKAIIPNFNEPKDMSAMFSAYINGVRDAKEILAVGVLSLLSKGYLIALDEEGNGKNVQYSVADFTQNTNLDNISSINMQKNNLFDEEKRLLQLFIKNKNRTDIFSDGEGMYKTGKSILNSLEDKYNAIIYKKNKGFLFPYPLSLGIFFFFAMSGGSLSSFSPMMLYIAIFMIVILTTTTSFSILPMVMLAGFVVLISGVDIFFIVFIVILLVMMLIYSKIIGKYTNSGLRKKEYLQGMKMYIKTAEENQLKAFNDVDELVAFFKKILPFAVALGVKNEAIKLLEKSIKIYNLENQANYISNRVYLPYYNNYYLTNNIFSSYNRGHKSIMEKEFRNNNSKGGGFSSGRGGFGGGGFSSGGGFSGGGSGGGGGGSW